MSYRQQQEKDEEYQQKYAIVFEKLCDGVLDTQFCEYIMEHGHGRVVICNGDTLIDAIESGVFDEEFVEYVVEREYANEKDFMAWVASNETNLTQEVRSNV